MRVSHHCFPRANRIVDRRGKKSCKITSAAGMPLAAQEFSLQLSQSVDSATARRLGAELPTALAKLNVGRGKALGRQPVVGQRATLLIIWIMAAGAEGVGYRNGRHRRGKTEVSHRKTAARPHLAATPNLIAVRIRKHDRAARR